MNGQQQPRCLYGLDLTVEVVPHLQWSFTCAHMYGSHCIVYLKKWLPDHATFSLEPQIPKQGSGTEGPKPTILYSNYPFILNLYLPLPKNVEWDAEMSVKHLGIGQGWTSVLWDRMDRIG